MSGLFSRVCLVSSMVVTRLVLRFGCGHQGGQGIAAGCSKTNIRTARQKHNPFTREGSANFPQCLQVGAAIGVKPAGLPCCSVMQFAMKGAAGNRKDCRAVTTGPYNRKTLPARRQTGLSFAHCQLPVEPNTVVPNRRWCCRRPCRHWCRW